FFFSSRRRHTRWPRDWSSDVCSSDLGEAGAVAEVEDAVTGPVHRAEREQVRGAQVGDVDVVADVGAVEGVVVVAEDLELLPAARSEEHTSELQSRGHLVCRLLLEKKH